MHPVDVFELVLSLLAVAMVLAQLARRLHVPPAAAYVVGGMLLAVTPGMPPLDMDPALIMALFLPPLLQSSAYFTVWRDFRANLRPILQLAIGAVVFTTLVVGLVLHWMLPWLPWGPCFVLGAIVSPPDAVAASAVLQRLNLPRRLVTVLEGESLVNDATGLVLYRLTVAATISGSYQVGSGTLQFILVGGGGVLVGLVCGRAINVVLRRLADTRMAIAASFLVSWASYLLAEALGVSGVLATVTCGLLMGWYQHEALSSRTRMEARATWGFAVFVLEALVFILIGLSLNGILARVSGTGALLRLLPVIAAISGTVIVARFVWIFPAVYVPRWLSPALAKRDPSPPPTHPLVLGWSGMRGVVSLAAALALPFYFPGRDAILVITFAVILVTVLVQGTTLGPLIRLLGLDRPRAGTQQPPAAEARAAVETEMLRLIEERAADPLVGAIAQDLLQEYRDRAGWASRAYGGTAAVLAERSARLRLRLDAIAAGRLRLLQLHRSAAIHDEALHQLEQELDLEELRVRGQLGVA